MSNEYPKVIPWEFGRVVDNGPEFANNRYIACISIHMVYDDSWPEGIAETEDTAKCRAVEHLKILSQECLEVLEKLNPNREAKQ